MDAPELWNSLPLNFLLHSGIYFFYFFPSQWYTVDGMTIGLPLSQVAPQEIIVLTLFCFLP